MSILGYSAARLLPRWWIENASLWSDKLIPLIDWFLSNNNVEKSKMSEAFYQIIDKYINTQDLPLEGLVKYIDEMGYGYINDFLQLDEARAKKLVAFLMLVHFLKGSRIGLELVLNIVGISAQITEWWEETPVGTPNTFTLVIDSSTFADQEDAETYRKFETFIRNYVYPEVQFKIEYSTTIGITLNTDLQGSYSVTYNDGTISTPKGRLLLEDYEEFLITDQQVINSALDYFEIEGDYTDNFLAGGILHCFYATGIYDDYIVSSFEYVNSLNATRVYVAESIPNSRVYSKIIKGAVQREYTILAQQVVNSDKDYFDIQKNTSLSEEELDLYNVIKDNISSESNIKGLWFYNITSGTEITDYSGNGNTLYLTKDASLLSADGRGISFQETDEYMYINDTDDFSFGDGISDSPFSVGSYCNVNYDSVKKTFLSKYYTGNKEWRFYVGDNNKTYFYLTDNSSGITQGRYSDVGSYFGNSLYTATYDGNESDPRAGIKIFRGGSELDTSENTLQAYVSMENTSAKVESRYQEDDASRFIGVKYVDFIIAEELTETAIININNALAIYLDKVGISDFTTHFQEWDRINAYYSSSNSNEFIVDTIEFINSLNITRIFVKEDIENSLVYANIIKNDNNHYVLTEDNNTISYILVFN